MENIDMKKAALDYASQGISVFPVVSNGKSPLTKNGFKDATTDLTVINAWFDKYPDANIGIPTGMMSSWFVVDVDNKNNVSGTDSLKALVAEYGDLPDTKQHSTPSGGYHLLFKYPGYDVKCSAGKIGTGLDIRCDGGYIVAPPSVIDGKQYQVLNQCVEVNDAPEWLITLATENKKPEQLSGQIVKGERNDHIFKIALGCNKSGMSTEDAEKVIQLENELCNPPLSDLEVTRTLSSAYKYEGSQTPYEIEELNRKHAFVTVGGSSRILNEVICPIFNRPDITLSKQTDFIIKYANRILNGKSIGDLWLKHPKRREYEGIVFAPGKETPKHYNLWRGFAVDPKEGDCSLYLKHIEENICSGDKKIFEYVIAWMADAVQNLDRLVGTSIVLKGKQGVGKGKFVSEFGKLFGTHFTHISQSSHLTGKFNAHLKHTYILFADEACWGGDKQAEGPLKALITESTILIEGKGQDPIAATVSGDLDYAELLYSEVQSNLLNSKNNIPAYTKLKERLPVRLAEIHEVKATYCLNSWFNTHDIKFIEQMDHEISKIDGRTVSVRALYSKAVCAFLIKKDVDEAIRLVTSCPKVRRDSVWHFNLAFLEAYKGNMKKSMQHYRNAIKFRIDVETLNQLESFIVNVIKDDPEQSHLYFCLGYINWKVKGDNLQAIYDYNKFIELADGNRFSEEMSYAKKWVDELTLLENRVSETNVT